MRESRTYGSGRGACDETHVPTATAPTGVRPTLREERLAQLVTRDAMIGARLPKRAEEVA
jgi:hypothetical protein